MLLHQQLECLESLQRAPRRNALRGLLLVRHAQPRQQGIELVAQQGMGMQRCGVGLRVLVHLCNGVGNHRRAVAAQRPRGRQAVQPVDRGLRLRGGGRCPQKFGAEQHHPPVPVLGVSKTVGFAGPQDQHRPRAAAHVLEVHQVEAGSLRHKDQGRKGVAVGGRQRLAAHPLPQV